MKSHTRTQCGPIFYIYFKKKTLAVVIYGGVLRDFGKGYLYSVIVSFGVIVSFCFCVFVVKGIFGVYATVYAIDSLVDINNWCYRRSRGFCCFWSILCYNHYFNALIASAGFWPRGQNPRGHTRVPRVYVYTYKRNIKKVLKKCVGSMEIFSI